MSSKKISIQTVNITIEETELKNYLEVYNNSLVEESNKKEDTPYILFLRENMKLLSANNDGKNSKERLKTVNEMWKLKKEQDYISSKSKKEVTKVKEIEEVKEDSKKKVKQEIEEIKEVKKDSKKKVKQEIEEIEEVKEVKEVKKDSKKKVKQEIEEVKEVKKKIPISSAVKRLVWNKYIGEEIGKAKCVCCKSTDIVQMSFHCGHVIAESNGGPTEVSNLRPICQNCNCSMGIKNMNDFMKTLL